MNQPRALNCAAINRPLRADPLYSVELEKILNPGSGRVLHVDPTAVEPADGSRGHPFPKLHQALAFAESGDTIVIADQEQPLEWPGDALPSVKALRIYAGFAPGFQARRKLATDNRCRSITRRIQPPAPVLSES